MKIYMVNPNPIVGGARTANLTIADILEREHKVVVNDEYYDEEVWNHPYPLDKYPLHQEKGKAASVEHILSYNPDVIIWANNVVSIYYISAIRKFKKMGIRQMMVFHSLNLSTSIVGRVLERLVAYTSKKMDYLLFVSEFTKKSWSKFRAVRKRPETHRVVYNAVNINTPKCKKKKSEKTVVGFVGRLSSEKQPEVFCKVAQMDNTRKYEIWGDGPLMDELKQKYGHCVDFKGFCSNPDDIYQSMDILVMTSLFENCPMVVLEAEARGIVPICPKVGGIPEIICSDKLMYIGFSPDTILETINIAESKIEEFGNIALNNVQQYSLDSIESKWKSILK